MPPSDLLLAGCWSSAILPPRSCPGAAQRTPVPAEVSNTGLLTNGVAQGGLQLRSFLFRPASCSSGRELLRHRAAAQLIPSCLVRLMSRWTDHFACRASVPVATAKRVKSPYRPAPVRRARSHERFPNGKYEWLTPPDLIRALGEFDLDPCPSRALPQPESAITTGPNHPLPRQDLHLQASQRMKAAPRNLLLG